MATSNTAKKEHTGKSGRPSGPRAASRAGNRNCLHVEVPGIGRVTLPPPDQLAFIGGLAALAALQIIEWPVGVVLAAGHLLADNRRNKILRDFGEALEEA